MQELRLYWEGTRESVEESIRRADTAGRLVDVERVSATRPGLVAAAVVLRGPAGPPGPPRRQARRPGPPPQALWIVVGLTVGLSVGLPAGWAARWLLEWVAAHAAAILGGLVVLVVLTSWWLAGQAGACPGLHCPGCRCGR